MATLITGYSGFVGRSLAPKLLAKGKRVYGLSRRVPETPVSGVVPLIGDVTKPSLGLKAVPADIYSLYHLAAIRNLGPDRKGELWAANVEGTLNVIRFCIANGIDHLFYTSTAYTNGRNAYERSKALCELMVRESDIAQVTIFKPSIIMGSADNYYDGHVSQFAKILIRVLRREELIRLSIEGALRLPPIRPLFRLVGKPNEVINLVGINEVVKAMAEIDRPGTYYLTNPNPPYIHQVVEWVGDFTMVHMTISEEHYTPSLVELAFYKMAAAFQPYLYGDNFPSHIKSHPQITKVDIHDTLLKALAA